MSPQPLVSVIIVTNDDQEYINPAVDSVLRQTHKNLEVIICDLGSVDNTLSIVGFYNHSSIKILRQANDEKYTALQHAVSTARGDFVTFIGAADLVYPEFLASLLKIISTQRNIDILSSDYITIDRNGVPKSVYSGLLDSAQVKLELVFTKYFDLSGWLFSRDAAADLAQLFKQNKLNDRERMLILSRSYELANCPKALYARRDVAKKVTAGYMPISSRIVQKQLRLLLSKKTLTTELNKYRDKPSDDVVPYLALLVTALQESASSSRILTSTKGLANMVTRPGFRKTILELIKNKSLRGRSIPALRQIREDDFPK